MAADVIGAAVFESCGIKVRGGSGFGGEHGDGTRTCGGDNGGGSDGWSPSLIFLEQPLEREFTSFFLQMTARVCGGGGGGSLPLL